MATLVAIIRPESIFQIFDIGFAEKMAVSYLGRPLETILSELFREPNLTSDLSLPLDSFLSLEIASLRVSALTSTKAFSTCHATNRLHVHPPSIRIFS